MSRWGQRDETVIRRALVVDNHGSASWDAYIRAASRADDGRDPLRRGAR